MVSASASPIPRLAPVTMAARSGMYGFLGELWTKGGESNRSGRVDVHIATHTNRASARSLTSRRGRALGTDVSSLSQIAKAQADFMREVTKVSTDAARRMLKLASQRRGGDDARAGDEGRGVGRQEAGKRGVARPIPCPAPVISAILTVTIIGSRSAGQHRPETLCTLEVVTK